MTKKKKILLVIIGIVVLIIISIVSFLVFKKFEQDRKEKEFIERKNEYITYYNNAKLSYLDIGITILIFSASDSFNEIIDDTILYWNDYLDNVVYGKSKYGLKTFDAVRNKLYKKYTDVYDKLPNTNQDLFELSKELEDVVVKDKNSKKFKQSLLDYYDAYVYLYESIFEFSTSLNGFKRDTSDAISNYNDAYREHEYYSGKFGNDYLDEYQKYVESVDFDKYCDLWSTENDSYTNYQLCVDEINAALGI